MTETELAEAITHLRHAISQGWLWCGNCDGRKCMACVLRDIHDDCRDDCPECCVPWGMGSSMGGLLRSVLPLGWDAPPPPRRTFGRNFLA